MQHGYADPLDQQIDRATERELPALGRLTGKLGTLRGLCRKLVAQLAGLDDTPRIFAAPAHDGEQRGEQLPPVMPLHPDPRVAPLCTEATRIANLAAAIRRLNATLDTAADIARDALTLDAAGWPGGFCVDCRQWVAGTGAHASYCQLLCAPKRADETCHEWEERVAPEQKTRPQSEDEYHGKR